MSNNLSVTEKIKETNEWLDQKLEELEVFKPKENPEISKPQTEVVAKEAKEGTYHVDEGQN